MRVITVFSGDRRRPIVDKISAISRRRASASACVPEMTRHQSSAYADSRVMPRVECWLPGDPR